MINKKVLTINQDGKKVLKTIIDDESNAKGREDVAYTAKAVDNIVQTVENSKANKTGELTTDFNAKTLTVSSGIVPSTTGLTIGTPTNRFDSIYVNEAYLSTNTLYLGDTPVMGTDSDTIMIKSHKDQSITMKTTGVGNSKIISENGVELSTSGPNADVIVQAIGQGSRAVLSANNNVDINAPNINITGDANINGPIRTRGLTVDGDMIINGETFTVNTTTIQTKDNIIEVNYGQVGSGVTAGQAGLKINRGDASPYYMVFDEENDMFKVGMVNSLQVLATQDWVNSNSSRPVHAHTSSQISDATNINTANMIVKRDSNGNFSAGTITATLSGNASSATKLATAKTINGVPFDGTNNITITAAPNSHNHDDLYKRKTDDYKITPKKLISGDNINTLYQSGFYVSDSDAISASIIGSPSSKGFALEVREIYGSGVSGRQIQIATVRETNEIYVRSKAENAEWTTWTKQALANHNHNSSYATKNHTHTSSQISDATADNIANTIVKRGESGQVSIGLASIGTSVIRTGGNDSTSLIMEANNGSVYLRPDKADLTKELVISKTQMTFNGNKIYHSGDKPTVSEIGAAAASHNQASSTINALTGYSKPSTTSALGTSDTLNTALGKLEKALDGKSATHDHPYRPDTWVPTWDDITSKPSFATVATSGSYNDLSNKPTIHTINDSTTTSTSNTWSAKKINDSLAQKAASSHTHTTSQITGLGSAATLNAGISANQVLKLDGAGKVPISTLPSIAINETFTAANQTAALALTVEVGDIVIVTADAKTYVCVDTSKTVFDDKFKALSSGTDSITKTEVETLLNNKVDKISGKGLSTNDFTTAYKTKLDGIATGANNYVHPNDTNTRHVTDSEKSTWNSKADGNHNHDSNYLKLSGGSVSGSLTVLGTAASNSFKVRGIQGITEDGASLSALYLNYQNTNPVYINGTNKVYHEGFKPTPADIGAASALHSHSYLPLTGGTITGSLAIGGALKDSRITSGNQQLVNANTSNIYIGNPSTLLKFESSANPTITVGSTTYTIYHEGNKPTPAAIGAATTSHGNHVPATQTADARKFLRNDNTWQSLPTASTSATGIVQLNNTINSTSTTQAATANAVKLAYDLANSKTQIIASATAPSGNVVGRVWIETS